MPDSAQSASLTIKLIEDARPAISTGGAGGPTTGGPNSAATAPIGGPMPFGFQNGQPGHAMGGLPAGFNMGSYQSAQQAATQQATAVRNAQSIQAGAAANAAQSTARFSMGLQAATMVLNVATRAIEEFTRYTRMDSEARSITLATNNVQQSEIVRGRYRTEVLRKIPIIGGLAGAISDQYVAQQENYLREQSAIRQSADRVGRFSGSISREIAAGNIMRMRGEYAEAQTLGGSYSRLIRAQNEQEMVKQQIAMAERAKELPRLTKAATDETVRLRKMLAASLKGLPKETAEAIRKIGKGGDPLASLLDRMQVPDDNRPDADQAIRQQRDGQRMLPILGG